MQKNTEMAEKKMEYDASKGMIDIKGKEYLPVAQRIVWFRKEHPEFSLVTELVEAAPGVAIFKATITDEKGRLLATGYGRGDKTLFPRYFEKSETTALGRCLSNFGYGTLNAEELRELETESDIADAPVAKPQKSFEQAEKDFGGQVIETPKQGPRISSPAQQKAVFAISYTNGHSLQFIGEFLGRDLQKWDEITFEEASKYIDQFGSKGLAGHKAAPTTDKPQDEEIPF